MTDRYTELRAALEAGPSPGSRRVSGDGLRVLDDTGGELLSRTPDECSSLRTERDDQQRANVVLAAAANPDTIRALLADYDRLREALSLAYTAMNYMGDILNEMDAVEEEDEEATAPAFEAVRAALAQEQGESDD